MLAMFAIVTLLTVFKSGLKIPGFLDFPIHSNTLPGPSACEVTALWCVFEVATLWRYTDLFLIEMCRVMLDFQILKFAHLESDEDRIKVAKEIYDMYIMRELLSQTHVSFISVLNSLFVYLSFTFCLRSVI